VESEHLHNCFSELNVAHWRDEEGYVNSWYDVVGDTKENLWHDFFFEME
jgi:hypothetical protein